MGYTKAGVISTLEKLIAKGFSEASILDYIICYIDSDVAGEALQLYIDDYDIE